MDDFKRSNMPPINSELLLAGQSQLLIAHKAGLYVLRLTKQDKLILTKLANNEPNHMGLKA